MKIDQVSSNVVAIALRLNAKIPGTVSEIWLDQTEVDHLKSEVSSDKKLFNFIEVTKKLIRSLPDKRRSAYLSAILHSLEYQIQNFDQKSIPYSDFSQNVFGFRIERVTEAEIESIQRKIRDIERKIGLTRQQVFAKRTLKVTEYESAFSQYVWAVKNALPAFITDFPDKGFEFELASGKPWSAFNCHIAAFRSRLSLNSDISFSELDLYRLASHEAYGGHHSELCHKDVLLTEQQRGEHGLVITFSPQVFVSEAIAEGMYVLLGGLNKEDDEQVLAWYYDRLIFALQNLATFWFFDDNIPKAEIYTKLKKYAVSDESAKIILDFSTDKIFGRYAPIYYSAFNFIQDLYTRTHEKEKLIKTLFTKPCTPKMLTEEFERG